MLSKVDTVDDIVVNVNQCASDVTDKLFRYFVLEVRDSLAMQNFTFERFEIFEILENFGTSLELSNRKNSKSDIKMTFIKSIVVNTWGIFSKTMVYDS